MEKKNFFQSHGDLYENVMQGIEQIFKESGKSILYFDDLDIKIEKNIKNGKDKYEAVDAVQCYHDLNDDLCIAFYLQDKSSMITINSIDCPIIPIFDLIYIYEQIYKAYENEKKRKDVKTVILNNLEWMTENLSEHDGTEINKNWYYTWEQAKKAAEEIGDGWRLPTAKEFRALCNLESTWNNEYKGRFFGENKELLLPANGYVMPCGAFRDLHDFCLGIGCLSASYWSSSFSDCERPIDLYFNSHGCLNPNDKSSSSWGYSVRLVRDIK